MKRTKLIFPLMFLLALGASAFSRYSESSQKVTTAYYFDSFYATCNITAIVTGQCITDPVGPICNQFVSAYGQYTDLFQNGVPTGCYTPFYTYP